VELYLYSPYMPSWREQGEIDLLLVKMVGQYSMLILKTNYNVGGVMT
jgi:hypothetical protein